uniref:CSON003807 protein n=1 Tax=Culicoides sonorensis TaxID=179676 RepID=A0A336L299_CULSO
MFEGLPKIKHCCGMDLKIICMILGVLELGFLALRLGNNFCLFHCNDSDSHFESKIWQTFVVIEFYIQLCIHIARVVLTICLMYGLVTRKSLIQLHGCSYIHCTRFGGSKNMKRQILNHDLNIDNFLPKTNKIRLNKHFFKIIITF